MRDSQIPGRERIEHVLLAINDIDTFMQDISEQDFLSDHKLINATLFQFAIIGEAIVHIDANVLSKYEYPWHKVRGFRNFILHEYHSIEFRIVWSAIKNDLPELKRMIELIRKKEF